jgi:hypothetical protein
MRFLCLYPCSQVYDKFEFLHCVNAKRFFSFKSNNTFHWRFKILKLTHLLVFFLACLFKVMYFCNMNFILKKILRCCKIFIHKILNDFIWRNTKYGPIIIYGHEIDLLVGILQWKNYPSNCQIKH